MKTNSCHGCVNLLHCTESWEMPHIWWKECAVSNAHNLRSFPFTRTKCRQWKKSDRDARPHLEEIIANMKKPTSTPQTTTNAAAPAASNP